MAYRPVNDRVLIKRHDAEERTPGGLYIPENAKEKPIKGTVLAVGPGRYADDGKLIPMSVKPGEVVLFGKYAGNEIDIEDGKAVVVGDSDILLVKE